jgi:hypothetical protein
LLDAVVHVGDDLYILEVKDRPVVPSDLEQISRYVTEIKTQDERIVGTYLLTSEKPSRLMLRMAKERGVRIIHSVNK